MASEDWPELLKRVELKFPFFADVKAELDAHADGWKITVEFHVPCVITGQMVTVYNCGVYPSISDFRDGEEGAIRALRTTVKRALLHELDESLWIDGRRWIDPHENDEKAAA